MDHLEALTLLREHLLSLQFVGTGVTSLGTTGTAFTRTEGSFVTDGFVPGMEVVPQGFTNTQPKLVRSVSATSLSVVGSMTSEGVGGGRSLTVGAPTLRARENEDFTPQSLRWHLEEDYIPGPVRKVNATMQLVLHYNPLFVLRLSGLANFGVDALYVVADGILEGFRPGLAFEMQDGSPLRVGTDPSPSRGQVFPMEAGRADIVIEIPLWKRTHHAS
jgi:hypothetical protein